MVFIKNFDTFESLKFPLSYKNYIISPQVVSEYLKIVN